MTKAQPENNIIRGAYYALAAALGGARQPPSALSTKPTPFQPEGSLLSLRTFQILMEEIGLRDTVDPLAALISSKPSQSRWKRRSSKK